MSRLIRVKDHCRLSLSEIYALSGDESGFTPKFKGEIFMDFTDIRTGKIIKHKHIKNTRTWWFKNVVMEGQRIDNQGNVFIANDDGDWHVRKNVARCTYANNGAVYFVDTTISRSQSPSTYIYQYVAQFNAAPAGTVKTINAIGICGSNQISGGTYAYMVPHVLAATRLSGAGETQDEYTVLDITYKLTCTI